MPLDPAVGDARPLDPGRIRLDDPAECAWWCGELGCDEAALRAAVTAVGDHPAAVRERLAQRGGGG